MALDLAKRGINIAVHYSGSATEAETTAEEIRALGVKAVTLQANLLDADQTKIVELGIHQGRILSVSVAIQPDAGSGEDVYFLSPANIAAVVPGYYRLVGTTIVMNRTASLIPFDSSDWDATSYNRGFITIQH